jgi:hypothetical protein
MNVIQGNFGQGDKKDTQLFKVRIIAWGNMREREVEATDIHEAFHKAFDGCPDFTEIHSVLIMPAEIVNRIESEEAS